MNECKFIGNLTRDPELSQTDKGVPVVNFTLAVNRKYVNKGGETIKDCDFIRCEAWDTGAETIADGFRKGEKMFIEASLRSDSWVDETGKKQHRNKFRVNHFYKVVPVFNRVNDGETVEGQRYNPDQERTM